MSILYQKLFDVLQWLDETGDPRLKPMWLLYSPWPVLIILVAYLYFVLKAGPAFMKYRGPMNIDRFVMVYDVAQVLCSFYIVKEAFRLVWFKDDYRLSCIEVDYSDTIESKQKLFVVWVYFFSKILDLLDTIFFVLRKKQNQVTFLHVYHHSMVITLSWCILRSYPGGQIVFFGTINGFVHIVMYSYYFLTVLKPEYKNAWWKKYLTQLQLIQFVITAFHGFMALLSANCNFPKLVLLFALPQDIFMFFLFLKFYKKAYGQSKNKLA